jgi:hypothetical protein
MSSFELIGKHSTNKRIDKTEIIVLEFLKGHKL